MQPFLSFAARLPDIFPRNGKFVGAAAGRDFNSRRVTFSLVDRRRRRKRPDPATDSHPDGHGSGRAAIPACSGAERQGIHHRMVGHEQFERCGLEHEMGRYADQHHSADAAGKSRARRQHRRRQHRAGVRRRAHLHRAVQHDAGSTCKPVLRAVAGGQPGLPPIQIAGVQKR